MDKDTRKVLIINADDLGYCEQRDRGIFESFERGLVTRATLLVNGFSARTAMSSSHRLKLPIGLHLNLTEGTPIAARDHVKTLISENGMFRGKHGFRKALKCGEICSKEIEIEIRAQINWFIDNTDSKLTHIDGHQHIHVLPSVCEPLAKCMNEYGIKTTRLPIQESLEQCLWIQEPRLQFFYSVVDDARKAREIFERNSISFSDGFIGLSTMGKDMTVNRTENAIKAAFTSCLTEPRLNRQVNHEGDVIPALSIPVNEFPRVTCEFMVHPGYKSFPGIGGCGEGPDDFAQSADREHEIEILQCSRLKDFIEENSIELCSL